jgi:hypothetical protein
MASALFIIARVASDLISWCWLALQPRKSLEAEVLFLRRQFALHVERGVKPRRVDPATRVSLAILSRRFEWRSALVVVRPETLIRWRRAGHQRIHDVFIFVERWLSETPGWAKVVEGSVGGGVIGDAVTNDCGCN